jgi:glycosyltransferase involved in cell wall biosynthesis
MTDVSNNKISLETLATATVLTGKPRICLTMIVKNEEHVIERALRSAIPFIDSYAICDTGSTDATKDIIQRVMDEAGKPGVIQEDAWVNFGHNRSLALAVARTQEPEGWSWMLDADDSIEGQPLTNEFWSKVPATVNAFRVILKHGVITHNRVQLFSNKYEWRYDGAVHEWPACKEREEFGLLPATIWQIARCEGARSQDPLKYVRDGLALKAELLTKPNDPRTLFYMAQSFRDAGLINESIEAYKRRIQVDGWAQEKYMAYVNLIKLTPSIDEKLRYGWLALEIDPTRLEAPYYVLHGIRRFDKFSQEAYAMGAAITNRTYNQNYLFPEPGIYEWAFDDELGIISFWKGHYKTAFVSSARALLKAPEQHKERLEANIKFSKEKLGLK